MAGVVVLYVLIAAAVAAGLTWWVLTARAAASAAGPTVTDEVYAAIEDAMAEVSARAAADRDAAVQLALRQAAVLGREQLGSAAERRAGRPGGEEGRHRHPARRGPLGGPRRAAAHRRARHRARHGQRPAVRPGRRVAAGPRRDRRHARRLDPLAARGAGQPPGPGPVGRADGRGRPAPGRVHRARQLPQADPGRPAGRAARTSRSSCPRATCSTWTSSSRWRRTCATSRSAPTPSGRRT